MTLREPAVAGAFYPGTAAALREMISGLVDEAAPRVAAIGALVPHAGYVYSGRVAGATISRLRFGDSFVVMGPSHTGLGAPFSLMAAGTWRTPLGDVEIDTELAAAILERSDVLRDDDLAHLREHAVEVQLPFLQYFRPDVRIVPLVLSHAEVPTYRRIASALVGAIEATGRSVTLLASGDMTHYEPRETAERKDRQGIEAILALDDEELLRRVRTLGISMCAYGPAAVLIAAARQAGATRAELVGYATSGDVTGDYSAVVGYAGIIVRKPPQTEIARLARDAVEAFVLRGERLQPVVTSPEMQARAGVFVSLHKNGSLRGCIGTFEPQEASVAEEIVANAISSATHDPRFLPVRPDELGALEYSVDVLTPPEPVDGPEALDPKRYGVIVESGWRRGLLLPDLEGVNTVKEQLEICRQKAGIGPDEPVRLYRFEVKRYR